MHFRTTDFESSLHQITFLLQEATPGLGAILDAEGGCVFRVWAPEAQHAELVLIGANSPTDDRVLGMRREGGNFAARAGGVRAVSLGLDREVVLVQN